MLCLCHTHCVNKPVELIVIWLCVALQQDIQYFASSGMARTQSYYPTLQSEIWIVN